MTSRRRRPNCGTRIGRQLRGQPRAEALTVAAFCYCLANDVVRAGIAVDAALDEAAQAGVEPPTLAAILLDALQSGIALRSHVIGVSY